jgi:hypothetical protein|tara:strand:- start:900 stop:1583 length:684 start_codon:yes stop_codon:yes gene_type:complete
MATYSSLKTAIINTTENDGDEFTSAIPGFIERTELRLTKDIDDVGLDSFDAITISASNPVVSLPNDRVRIIRNVNYTTSTSSLKTSLLQRTYEYAIDYWPYASASVGTPRYYSRKTNSAIYIVPTPTSTLTGEIQTVQQPLPLASATGTSVTTTNYFSQYCYDALFYGCMMEATMFMKDWQTLPVWQQQYEAAIMTLRNQARRTRQDDMEIAASPSGSPDPVVPGSS